MYEYLESIDALRIHTARIDGRLVGYRSLALTTHQHTSQRVARCDALYTAPEHRGWTGARLLRWSDRALADEEIAIVYQAHKPARKDLTRLLQATGYLECEVTYARRLITD